MWVLYVVGWGGGSGIEGWYIELGWFYIFEMIWEEEGNGGGGGCW